MNDHELDRLVASAAPVRDRWVAGLDLRDAENELMEEIMATTNPEVTLQSESPGDPPPRSNGSRSRFRLAIALAAAAALLIGVVAVRTLTPDDKDGVVQSPTPDILPMIADALPQGMAVTAAWPESGFAHEPQASGPIDTWIYGDLTPTAVTSSLVLQVTPELEDGSTMLGEPVTVRGKPGVACSPGPYQCDFGNKLTGVVWTEGPDVRISIESGTFDKAQLLAIAEGVVVNGMTVTPGRLPAGITLPPKLAELNGDWGWGYTVDYRAPDGASFSVNTMAETEALHIYNLWRYGPRVGAEVQGHTASIYDLDQAYELVWEPSPGVLVEILTKRLDKETTLALAQTVRPGTAAEWKDLQKQAKQAPKPEMPGEEPLPDNAVHRKIADRGEVWAFQNAEGKLGYRDKTPDGSGGTLTEGDPDVKVLGVSPSTTNGVDTSIPAVVGLAPVGTASIDGGEATLGDEVEGGILFVWEYPVGERWPDTLTFRDTDGNELATIEVVVY